MFVLFVCVCQAVHVMVYVFKPSVCLSAVSTVTESKLPSRLRTELTTTVGSEIQVSHFYMLDACRMGGRYCLYIVGGWGITEI